MKNHSSTKVIFYRVKDNSTKIHLICTKVQEAFKQEKRLLIAVPNLQAAQYIDALLWRTPAESFLPHIIADTPTPEWVVITMQEQNNINQAPHLLNLCPTPSALYQQAEEVYDLYDETHSQKTELSQQRMHFYQAKGLVVNCQ